MDINSKKDADSRKKDVIDNKIIETKKQRGTGEETEVTTEDISIKDSIISFEYSPKYTGDFPTDKEIFQRTCAQSLINTYNIRAKRMLDEALDLVYSLFKDDKRGDGSMFYTHFLETADLIMTKFHFDDPKTVTAALLHDSPEDKPHLITIKDIEKLFDSEIAQIVDGVTKITKTEDLKEKHQISVDHKLNYDEQELATLYKIFEMGARNPKIFLVKLADRFHNILTLYGIKNPERRKQIAEQTINVYVPLLKGFGFEYLSGPMRDWCLFHIVANNQKDARQIYDKLKTLHSQEHKNFLKFAIEYKLEEFFKSHFPNLTFVANHKTLFELYEASKPDIVKVKSDYNHYYPVLVSSASTFQNLSLPDIENALKTNFKYFEKNEPPPILRQRLLEETNKLTLARYILATSDNKQFELEIVAEHTELSKKDRNLNIQRRFNREFYKFNDPSEYQSFLDILAHLIRENIPTPNKVDILLSLSNKLSPNEYVYVTLFNDNNTYFLPKGSIPLDLAFKSFRNKALLYITAKVVSSESQTPKTVPLNYILHNGDKVEIILGETPTLSPDSMDYVFTLYAYNSLKKHFQATANEATDKSKQKGTKKLSISGSNRVGINAAIAEIARNLNMNFTDIQLKVNPLDSNEFNGALVIEYASVEQFNVFFSNLANIEGIKNIKIL